MGSKNAYGDSEAFSIGLLSYSIDVSMMTRKVDLGGSLLNFQSKLSMVYSDISNMPFKTSASLYISSSALAVDDLPTCSHNGSKVYESHEWYVLASARV